MVPVDSQFLRDIQAANEDWKSVDHSAREMTFEELQVFVQNGNQGRLRVVCDKTSATDAIGHIRNCEFIGSRNVLIILPNTSTSWIVSNTSFENSLIESGSIVKATSLVSSCVLRSGCTVSGCGSVLGRKTSFGNGISISPGLETGGRAVKIIVESSLEQLARVALDQFKQPQDKQRYDEAILLYCLRCSSEHTLVMPNARLVSSPHIEACYVGRGATVSSGARIVHSALLDGAAIEQGCDVLNSLMQRRSHASTQAIVKDSLICEGGSVEIQGKLLTSILGPGSHLAEGEITSSLIGPMVGFHHQSMLIATYWPSGRGNVGYGANCGSNHTSRVSDQTMWPGEGVFFGLGCSVKFPLNLSEAPYTVLATGVVFGPGRLSFPMSLVTSDSSGCRVAPGWGFASNCYALQRNSNKMKSRAPKGYAWEITRTEVASLVWSARETLQNVLKKQSPEKAIFRDDPESGFNLAGGYCTRDDIIKGIAAYTRFLELYALRGAVRLGIRAVPSTVSGDNPILEHDVADTGLTSSVDAETAKQHVECVLSRLFPPGMSVKNTYLKAEASYVKNVYDSKARDHVRGRHVFPPGRYDEAIPLEKDSVIMAARSRLEDIKSSL